MTRAQYYKLPGRLFRRIVATLILVTLVGCGGGEEDEGSTPPPRLPPATVVGDLSLTWEQQDAFGGQARALLYRRNTLFAIHDDSVWRFDPVEEEWSVTSAKGSRLNATDDDYLFTDWGWRLVPGEVQWTTIGAEAISVGSNGRTIFGLRQDRTKPVRSDDYGETWTKLPATPANAIAIAEATGDVYVSLTTSHEGVWRLNDGGATWHATPLDRLVTAFHITPEGNILAKRSHDLYWSESGDDWRQVTVDGQALIAHSYAGRSMDDRPLVAVSDTVYVLTVAGDLEPLSAFPGHEPVLAFAYGNTNVRYLSDDTGLWHLIADADTSDTDLIGMPGDFLRKVFHLTSGTYGAFDHDGGSANWQRYDPQSGRWHHVALASALVNDVVELPHGGQLLATQSVEEGGYGDVYTLDESGQLTALITAGPQMIAAAVDDDGRWFIATGNSREESEYQVLLSEDGGATWSDTALNANVADLDTVCGMAYAATSAGLSVYENGQWRANAAVDAPLIGIQVRDSSAAFFSADRLWYTSNCMEQIESVALPAGYQIHDLAIDHNAGLWVASGSEGIVRQAGESDWLRFDRGLPHGAIEISIDDQGKAWTRVRDFGLYTADITL